VNLYEYSLRLSILLLIILRVSEHNCRIAETGLKEEIERVMFSFRYDIHDSTGVDEAVYIDRLYLARI
jgi:hypothetical protein